jgi:hypothetical protein
MPTVKPETKKIPKLKPRPAKRKKGKNAKEIFKEMIGKVNHLPPELGKNKRMLLA